MPLRDQVELRFLADVSPPRVTVPAAALGAERVELAPSRFEYATTGEAHYLALHDIVMDDGEICVGGDAPIRQTDLRRTMTFLPAGVRVTGWTDPLVRPNSFVALHFDAEAIPAQLRGSANFEDPAVYFRDRRLCETLTKLDRAMRADAPSMALLADALCDLAVRECGLRFAKVSGSVVARPTPSLSQSQIMRVRDFIAGNLSASISLSDLSAVIGLSKFHFARAFKATAGRSPYQEVLQMRLAVARRLLSGGCTAEVVAARTGFTNARQLRRAIRLHPQAK
ncbi:AraC family transcriptional regulator [uncultured Phenylobacterium sp.]|uniref:AraC family transcriptional regulator n=1 Tax=uncultured Phenylobacterium sp. TaxID=349273 RepID=UPI0025FE1F69|nr:AraC family transcriptional regulator [uncultured Phenylobacterium sp.]